MQLYKKKLRYFFQENKNKESRITFLLFALSFVEATVIGSGFSWDSACSWDSAWDTACSSDSAWDTACSWGFKTIGSSLWTGTENK